MRHKENRQQTDLVREDLYNKYLKNGSKITMYLGEDSYDIVSVYAEYKTYRISIKKKYESFPKFLMKLAVANTSAVEAFINE
jgi:hypothetical protein